MSVLIIGGGIGGLATAVALSRVGITAQVFERAPEIREVGAAVSIWSNAVKALRRLGLEERLLALGSVILKHHFLTPAGQLLSTTDIDEISRACGAASAIVHRGDLQRLLLEALDADQVNTSKECVGVAQDEDGVTVRFGDGTDVRGAIAVGADGINSAVAASMFGDANLRFAGYHCYRAMATTPEVPSHEAISILLPGVQFGLFPDVRPQESYWFLCCKRSPAPTAAITNHDFSAQFRSIAPRLREDLGNMISRTDPGSVIFDEVFDRPRRRNWGRGRVTLLGDAAHPTTPTFGQGACMALEDAVVLAHSVQRERELVAGLRRYEERRRSRTAMITRLSWRYGKSMQFQHPALVRWRTLSLATPLARWNERRVMRRLLDFDAPDLTRSDPI